MAWLGTNIAGATRRGAGGLFLPGARVPRSWWVRHATAPLFVALAAILQLCLLPQPTLAPFVFLYLSVALSALLGGRGRVSWPCS